MVQIQHRGARRSRAIGASLLILIAGLAGCTAPVDQGVETASAEADTSTAKVPSAPAAKVIPARLDLLDASVSATEVAPRETVTLRFRVQNTGTQDGAFALQLLVNGEVHVEKSYRVFAGALETGSLEFAPPSSGIYTLSLATSVLGSTGGTSAFSNTFRVVASLPANLQVIDATVSRKEVPVGESTEISAVVANVGERPGTREIKLLVEGKVEQAKSISVGPNGRESISFSLSKAARGRYSVSVDDRLAGTVEFFVPATFEPVRFEVSDDRPQLWQYLNVKVQLRNIGDRSGSVAYAVKLGSQTLRQDNQPLGADAFGPVLSLDNLIANVTFTTPQQLQLLLDGKVVREITVTPRTPQLDLYGLWGPYGDGHGVFSDDATFSFYLANNGTGRAPGVGVSILLDGKPYSLKDQAQNAPYVLLGTIEPGKPMKFTKSMWIDLYADGACDKHTFELRIHTDYGMNINLRPQEGSYCF